MVKGMSYTLESAIGGFIVIIAIAFLSDSIQAEGAVPGIVRDDVSRCLVDLDNRGVIRPFLEDASGPDIVDSNITSCIESTYNHTTSFCGDTCDSSGTAPSDVERTVVNYYVAGYTDLDPVRVSVVMWR